MTEALDSLDEGLALFDADDRLVACNASYRRLFPSIAELIVPGVAFEELIRAVADRQDTTEAPEAVEQWVRERLAARDSGQEFFEHDILGDRILRGREQETSAGGTVSTYSDVTEAKQRERALEQRTALLETALNHMAQGLIVFDADLTILASNRNAATMLDMPAQVLQPGESFDAVVRSAAERGDYGPGNIEDLFRVNVEKARSGNNAVIERKLPDGRFLIVRQTPMPGGGGVATYTDVTPRREAEAELAKQKSLFEAIFRDVPDALIIFDTQSKIIMCNPGVLSVFGYEPSELIGQQIDVLYEDALPGLGNRNQPGLGNRNQKGHISKAAPVNPCITSFQRKNGDTFSGETVRTEVRRAGGETYGSLWLVRDVTERMKVEALNTRLGRIIEQSDNEIYVFDVDTLHFVQANRGARENLGYSMDELRERTPFDLKPDFDEERFESFIAPLRDGTKQLLVFQTEHMRKDGSTYPVEVRLQLNANETPSVFVAVIQDITARKQAEAALRASEARLSTAQRIAQLGNWEWNLVNNDFQCSEEGYRIFGLRMGEAGITFDALLSAIHPDDRDLVQQAVDRAVSGKCSFNVDHRVRLPGGEERIARSQGEVAFDKAGAPVRMTGTIQDITEQKHAERELRISGARLRRQNEVLGKLAKNLAVAGGDTDAALREITEAGCRTLGVERVGVWILTDESDRIICSDLYELGADRHSCSEELLIHDNAKFFTALEAQRNISAEDAQNDPLTRSLTDSYLAPNGISSILAAPIYSGGNLVGVISIEHAGAARVWALEEQNFAAALADMVSLSLETRDRKQTEVRLQLTQFSVDQSGDSVFWLGPSGRFIYANDTACRSLGYTRDELLRLTVADITPDLGKDGWERQWERVKLIGSLTIEALHRTKEGCVFPAEVLMNYLEFGGEEYCFVFARDVSERKSTEERLRQGQKMEALGQLAGGIAHEFNNLLTSISGFTRMAMKKPDDQERVESCLKEVVQASNQAADLTRQMLTFSHKQILEPKVVRSGDVISSMDKLLRAFIEETIDLQLTVENGEACIEVDAARLSQCVVNLAINARHAMPEGGKLEISCDMVELESSLVTQHADELPAGRYVKISVQDEGMGIDPDVLEHIFEPFFTTKDPGSGTGLGLSLVYGMVKSSGGVIQVDSKVGAGTTFSIYLPVVDKEPDRDDAEAELQPEAYSGSETILVAEDDAQVRTFVRTILEDQGYTVLTAPNGAKAIEICEQNSDRIRMLLTDVVMPEIGGLDLAKSLTEKKPDLKVVYMTGYAPGLTEISDQLRDDITVLRKPFEPEALARVVRETLSG